jgi:pilus assembly protein Flp/PilA
MLFRSVRDRKGQALVEYALLVAGIALISAAAVSVLGYKTSGLIAAVAAVLPGAEASSNGPISSGHLIETTPGTTLTGIALDVAQINTDSGTPRLGINVLGADPLGQFGKLVLDNTP